MTHNISVEIVKKEIKAIVNKKTISVSIAKTCFANLGGTTINQVIWNDGGRFAGFGNYDSITETFSVTNILADNLYTKTEIQAFDWFGITTSNITNWDTAYSQTHTHGNKTLLDSLKSDGDGTKYLADNGLYQVVSPSITNHNELNNLEYENSGHTGFQPAGNYITTEIDPVFTASPAFGITTQNITDRGTAFGRGNHASVGYELASNKNINNGYCPLDGGGKVPLANLPSTLLKYIGVWNANTNTPALTANDITKKGYVYNVGTPGVQFGITWSLGDWAIYNDNGDIEKSDNSDDVVSVNGQTGTVVLNSDNISEGVLNLYYKDSRARLALSSSATGLLYDNTTGVFSLDTGYTIPTSTFLSGLVPYTGANQEVKLQWDGIDSAFQKGLSLVNDTPTTSVITQQYSPTLAFKTHSWISGADHNYEWQLYASSSSFNFRVTTDGATIATPLYVNALGFANLQGSQATISIAKTGMVASSGLGIYLEASGNTTSGTPVRYSPDIVMTGRAWNTSSTPASNSINFKQEVIPTSGATTGGSYVWAYDNNGGGYANLMTLDNTGKLGIGGNVPIAKLGIISFGSETINDIMFSYNSANSYRNGIANIQTGGDATSCKMIFRIGDGSPTNQISAMTLVGNGYVGIGITNPLSVLDIKTKTVAGFPGIKVSDYTDGSGIYTQSVSGGFYRGISSDAYYRSNETYKAVLSTSSIINMYGGDIVFSTDTGITPGNVFVPNKRMIIKNTGNIGIGIMTPSAKLHVKSSAGVQGYIISDTTDTSGIGKVNVVSFQNAGVEKGWFGFGSVGINAFSIYNGFSDGDIKFYAGATNVFSMEGIGAVANSLHIKGGKVGIGTTTPDEKLEVIGNIKIPDTGVIKVGDWTNQTGAFDMSLGFKVSKSLISGMDFYNTNSAGQVRLQARNDAGSYLALNAPGSAVTTVFFGQQGKDLFMLLSQGSSDTDKKLAIGTYNAGDLIFGTANTERVRILATGNMGIATTTPQATLDVLGTARFGDSTTNYTEFEADGTMVAKGTATCYKDVVIPLLPKTSGAGNPTLSTFVDGLEQYKFEVNDKVQCENAEAPHDWEEGTGIEIHVHWSNSTQNATARYVKFELSYTFANMVAGTNTSTVFPVNTPVTFEATIPANTPAFSNLYSTIITLNDAFMNAYKIGCGLILKIKRIASTGTAPSGDPFIFNLGIHYKVNTLGSRNTTSK